MASILPVLISGMNIRESYDRFMNNLDGLKGYSEGSLAAIMEISLADYRCFLHLAAIDDQIREKIFEKEYPLHVSAEIAISWYHKHYEQERLIEIINELQDEEKKLSIIVHHRLDSGIQAPRPIDALPIFREERYMSKIVSIRKSRGCCYEGKETKENSWRRSLMRYEKKDPTPKQMAALFNWVILNESEDATDPWVGDEISEQCPQSVEFVERYRKFSEALKV
ncbi:MAG: hypothetical protein HOE69_07500 [Euryarchaeota archaeon]|jgi:hypothetical protein|nr:hypothetical protein [Euryarchaeota archaeon]